MQIRIGSRNSASEVLIQHVNNIWNCFSLIKRYTLETNKKFDLPDSPNI